MALGKAVEAQAQEAAQAAEQEQAEVRAEVQAGEEWEDTVLDQAVSVFVPIAGIVFPIAEESHAHRRHALSAEQG